MNSKPAEEKRDSLMQASLRRYIRPVKIEPGRIEVALTEGAPRTLPGDLQRRLLEWTGRRWTVTISSAEGGPTIEETVAARHDALVSDATADPEVAAILAQFPGAKVIDVRLRGEALAAEAATLSLSEAPRETDGTDDVPIEAGDDDDDL